MATSGHDSDETEMEIDSTEDAESEKTTTKRRRKDEGSSQDDKINTDAKPPDKNGRFMLRQLNIKNFVKFKEEQEMRFDSAEVAGVYFLIGPNQTGKSSIFEAIRRCMRLKYQSSASSAPDEKEDSIVVCKFKNETDTIFSFYIRSANTDEKGAQEERCILFKGCVLLDNQDKVKEFGMDRVEYHAGKFKSHKINVSPTLVQDFPKPEGFSLDAFQKWFCNMIKKPEQDDAVSTCEAMLEKNLDNIVSAFPMRGIGPLQWSKSSKIQNQTENYSEACQRAEVVMWYLEQTKRGKITAEDMAKEQAKKTAKGTITDEDMAKEQAKKTAKGTITDEDMTKEQAKKKAKVKITDEDMTKEQAYYDFITNTKDVKYLLEPDPRDNTRDGARNIKENIIVKTSKSQHSILKQSEGLVEAKLCSILLAVSDFTTVLLEDPGTGMHPQMIDRLCTILTEKVKDKVVIITTHNPGFLKPWLLQNIFYFNKDLEQGFKVTSGKYFATNDALLSAIPGSITMEQFANFCCAETIVFLEGPSDQLFLEALTRFMRNTDFRNNMLFSSLQFVDIGGQTKKVHFRKCCKILNKRYAFILDGDVTDVEKTLKKAIEEELKDKLLNEAEKKKLIQIEKEDHFFLWNFKNLEAVFFNGVVKELMDKKTQLTYEICTILKLCFPNYVDFTDEFVISSMRPLPDKAFKIFLHGKQKCEDRIKLIDFVLKNADSTTGALDIKRLQEFLEKLDA